MTHTEQVTPDNYTVVSMPYETMKRGVGTVEAGGDSQWPVQWVSFEFRPDPEQEEPVKVDVLVVFPSTDQDNLRVKVTLDESEEVMEFDVTEAVRAYVAQKKKGDVDA